MTTSFNPSIFRSLFLSREFLFCLALTGFIIACVGVGRQNEKFQSLQGKYKPVLGMSPVPIKHKDACPRPLANTPLYS